MFCAIRPEVKYHAYTFSTCNFAKNASVVKLQPKKAVAFSSPAERKLMDELEQMKVGAIEAPWYLIVMAGGGVGLSSQLVESVQALS